MIDTAVTYLGTPTMADIEYFYSAHSAFAYFGSAVGNASVCRPGNAPGRTHALCQQRSLVDAAASFRWHTRPHQRPARSACSNGVGMIGGHSRTARRIAGGGTSVPENGWNDAAKGWASPHGRSSRPARSVQHEPRPKIALQTPFAALTLVEGKPNGECRFRPSA